MKVGIRNGDDVQVTDGLKGGERVVTVGAFELTSEDDRRPGQDEDSGAGSERCRTKMTMTTDQLAAGFEL